MSLKGTSYYDMARNAGLRGEEAEQMARMIYEQRRREESQMSEQALNTHLDSQEQRPPEEMINVEKAYLEWLEGKPSVPIKASDGDIWLVFPDTMISIESICKFGLPGPIVRRNLRRWRDRVFACLMKGYDDPMTWEQHGV